MEKCFFHASFTPSFDGKVKIAQKRLIVASPDQFSWILHVRAYQNWYCSNFFLIFYIVIRFFLAQVVEVKVFAIGQFWLGGLVGQNMVISISYSLYAILGPLYAPIANFIQIG